MSTEQYWFFWSEKLWLPPNMTWEAFKSEDNMRIPQPTELLLVVPMALSLFIVRMIYERLVGKPIAKWYSLKEHKSQPAKKNKILESLYRSINPKLTTPKVTTVNKALLSLEPSWTNRDVERWWRRRKLQDNLSPVQKFCETSTHYSMDQRNNNYYQPGHLFLHFIAQISSFWRFFFYVSIFSFGCFSLYDKSFLWTTSDCWVNYPRQHVADEVYWYYLVELGFYFSLILSLFMDSKRKDFYEMMIHHVATILLLMFSWCNNMMRLGSTVLLLHDSVDFWLEGAKLAKYLRYQKLCDVLFVIFAVAWFITRLCIFPSRFLWSSLNEGHHIIGAIYPVYFIFNSMMITLQILHIIWFYYICRMVYSFVVTGKVEKDGRSDTESSSNAEEYKKKEN